MKIKLKVAHLTVVTAAVLLAIVGMFVFRVVVTINSIATIERLDGIVFAKSSNGKIFLLKSSSIMDAIFHVPIAVSMGNHLGTFGEDEEFTFGSFHGWNTGRHDQVSRPQWLEFLHACRNLGSVEILDLSSLGFPVDLVPELEKIPRVDTICLSCKVVEQRSEELDRLSAKVPELVIVSVDANNQSEFIKGKLGGARRK